jgi:hypothetical protein
LNERIKVREEIESILKEIKFKYGDFDVIDNATDKTESPVAEVSRLLIDNFELTNSFNNVNSQEIANLIGRKLSTPKIHKAILKNFDGVRFRKQNGGYTYTLRRRDTTKLKE